MFKFFFKKVNNNLNHNSELQKTKPYSNVSIVFIESSKPKNKGSFIDTLIRSSTFCVYVAENNAVYLFLGNKFSI